MTNRAHHDPGYSVESYFTLVERGLLSAEDHVELLEGLIVASPPQGPLHASVIMCVDTELRKAVGDRASLRIQLPLLAGTASVPEPDIAVVSGTATDYAARHPDHALLVVEISDSALPQDRLTKSRIYARGGVVEYWIVNLRDRCLEVHSRPDVETRVYAVQWRAEIGEVVELVALPGARVAVAKLFPVY